MKYSLFKNDKSTASDELILFVLIILSLAIGVGLVLWGPSFWIIDSTFTKSFGVLWIVLALMFIPWLVYRLLTNDKH